MLVNRATLESECADAAQHKSRQLCIMEPLCKHTRAMPDSFESYRRVELLIQSLEAAVEYALALADANVQADNGQPQRILHLCDVITDSIFMPQKHQGKNLTFIRSCSFLFEIYTAEQLLMSVICLQNNHQRYIATCNVDGQPEVICMCNSIETAEMMQAELQALMEGKKSNRQASMAAELIMCKQCMCIIASFCSRHRLRVK